MLDLYLVNRLIDLWLAEDIGHGDITSLTMIDADAKATFAMNARQPIAVAGVEVAAACFRRYDPGVQITLTANDGDRVAPKTTLLKISGKARSLLTVERTALNIVQHLSGIATETARWMDAIKGTKAKLIDTRKTTPGLRALQKHAVICGGGANHRLGLDSGVMIKDNHIAVCGSIAKAVERARAGAPALVKIEVECDRLEQVKEALAAKADVIMLDNMSLDDMRTAVKLIDGRIPLEASGGVKFDTVRAIAETGVDFISSSKMIQGSPAVDIGLDEA
ncbi:MAG TPA: carboxylating nicotinate-nucleotide diphosphorylase [Pseudolabrys sp.]|jgi:nicotinate-nucleotide pyrophosphorylase (carboxylating)|uniref:carboxylating nicotinate-nucleotide diphosphorylase n=1 Tax=Pseudolabrys sp. TaxID=1960880 RepID=UPI002DDD47CF|nr:carboxylating nicotinate-nucleotide diphosphorylase [Pseudolabrys sp.]HEV2627160.1 carboxylating nicotinate-nucleotide diphosphorylase [Pseudolabrys sp.]